MEQRMAAAREQTKAYYESAQSEPCGCAVCKNYYARIKAACPKIDAYLASLGVDILQPLELVFIENESDVDYYACQYVVFGRCDRAFAKTIDGIGFAVSTCHPSTGVQGEHFVLEFGTVTLPFDET